MDWNMPRMNGLDAVQQIRAAGNEVPVIMVTTEAEKERVVAAIKAGADNYVVKPFTAETIIKKIAATCPEHFQSR
jgi:two-component system chemotaxis response regulator CheY